MGIKSADRKRLWGRAHNQCAYPRCSTQLTQVGSGGDEEPDVVGEEAHIRSPQPGGPRYDSTFSRAKLDRYENLILLCPTHHSWADTGDGRNLSVGELLRIKSDHERRGQVADRIERTVRAYVADQYGTDDRILFERVELNGPSLESLFVDVPMAAQIFTDGGVFLDQVSADAPGDADELVDLEDWSVCGAAQALLHPAWSGNAMIIGGPGQGKSTLLQYVCQWHRARLLHIDTYRGPGDLQHTTTPQLRVPVRIDLRRYAAWPGRPAADTRASSLPDVGGNADGRAEMNRSLELYLAEHIDERAGHTGFTANDLLELVAAQPVLVALDGLDEVASTQTRDDVARAILDTSRRLASNAYDLMVLVSTRPGTSNAALWSSPQFPKFYLQRLTPGLRHLYLDRWVQQARLNPERAHALRTVFLNNENAPHVRDLASNPMQLAIVLHLLHKRGLLPQERTELYANYIETFLDREDDKEPLVKSERDLVEDFHAFLAWHLHARAELGDTSGTIDVERLRRDLADYLAENSSKDRSFVDELFEALTGRVICLVERVTGSGLYEFEVQSLREYFAARYVFQHVLPNRPRGGATRDDALNELLARPYWSNVFRFLIGMLSKGEIRASLGNLCTLPLTGESTQPHPHARTAAALLLDDRVFRTQPTTVFTGAAELLFGGSGVVLVDDDALGGPALTLSEDAGREEARVHLARRLITEQHRESRRALANVLLRHHQRSQLVRWWWEQRAIVAPLAWLSTAADLRALAESIPERLDEIEQIVFAAAPDAVPDEPLCLLLAHAGLTTPTDAIAALCIREIGDGRLDGRLNTSDAAVSGTFVAQLARDASTASGHRAATTSGAATQTLTTRRRRQRRPFEAVTALASVRAAAHSMESMTSDIDRDAWARDVWVAALAAIEQAWGDSWVLRRAILVAPSPSPLPAAGSAVPNVSADAGTRGGIGAPSGWEQVDAFVTAARANRGTAAWWRAHAPRRIHHGARNGSARDGRGSVHAEELHVRTWLLTLLLTAPARTMCDLGREISTAVDQLTPAAATALRIALHEGATVRAGALDMRDALRLGRTQISPAAAALLRPLVHDSTRSELDKIIAADVACLLTSGLADDAALEVMDSGTKRVDVSLLRHTRSRVTARTWNPDITLKAMSRLRAAEVVSAPQEWPTPIVLAAVRKLTEDLAKLPALAHISDTQHWFTH